MNNLIEVSKDQFFSSLNAEQKDVLTHTIEGGGKGNFFPLVDIWYYKPNQSNVFGKTIQFGTHEKQNNKYYLTTLK